MSKIIAIGTAVPGFRHEQAKIFDFMHCVYALTPVEKRKLRFLYQHCGIQTRYSVIPDFGLPANEWKFSTAAENLEPFPGIDERLDVYNKNAAPLALKAIRNCLYEVKDTKITHLLTVSCTGMSAPGLDLELLELLDLPPDTWRSSVNFMGCYAVIHAMKIADSICRSERGANVLIVSVECCTLHFQKDYTEDNFTSSLLFGDGAAAIVVSGDENAEGLTIGSFYSTVSRKGKKDMAWEMSSRGFLMTLSGYIPSLIEEDFNGLVNTALEKASLTKDEITHWCLHPGGKKILEAVHKSLGFTNGQLQDCYEVLNDYGNMSSPTVLFVLDRIRKKLKKNSADHIFWGSIRTGTYSRNIYLVCMSLTLITSPQELLNKLPGDNLPSPLGEGELVEIISGINFGNKNQLLIINIA